MGSDTNTHKFILALQQKEITEELLFSRLASFEKEEANRAVLLRIASEKETHYEALKAYSGKDLKPEKGRIFSLFWQARIFGITFTLKRLLQKEKATQVLSHKRITEPDICRIAEEIESHDRQLFDLINEDRLQYMGAVVLGLNDALVEFTGALAGFTLALNDSKLIALTGSITGIAAALSMASSEYLSTKSEEHGTKRPVKASAYTGIAYLITVGVLVSPFIFIDHVIWALCLTLLGALCIIAIFNYYYAVAKDENFKKKFSEMAVLSFSVAAISFLIGFALKKLTGINGG